MSNGSIAFDLEICSAISARLEQCGVSRYALLGAYSTATHHGTSFCVELIQRGDVAESAIYAAIADLLGLEFTNEALPSRIFVSGEEKPSAFIDVGQVMVLGADGNSYLYIAPSENRIRKLRDHILATPQLKSRIRICTPTLLKQIMRQRHQKDLIARAHEMTPQSFSAARVLDTPQAFIIAMAIYAFFACVFNWPTMTLLVLHVALSVFFFGCVMIRLFAAVSGRRLKFLEIRKCNPRDLPNYSVLVPLYREQEVIGQLI
ncbi:N-acetylglucosaminyltransferase, partial [Brucella anthropi]|nr:N-acetylglucosaminyltransferase [Brucella anthropi]MDH0580526.1 N-acetylglucosaminyltransferase [Brucella anthropi]MDH0817150.1 N-acetylglucosaminyltransferase [Brucella anthropi]